MARGLRVERWRFSVLMGLRTKLVCVFSQKRDTHEVPLLFLRVQVRIYPEFGSWGKSEESQWRNTKGSRGHIPKEARRTGRDCQYSRDNGQEAFDHSVETWATRGSASYAATSLDDRASSCA